MAFYWVGFDVAFLRVRSCRSMVLLWVSFDVASLRVSFAPQWYFCGQVCVCQRHFGASFEVNGVFMREFLPVSGVLLWATFEVAVL